jgi:hypothetical protein
VGAGTAPAVSGKPPQVRESLSTGETTTGRNAGKFDRLPPKPWRQCWDNPNNLYLKGGWGFRPKVQCAGGNL